MDLGVNFGGSLRDFVATNFAILVNATSVGFRAPDANPLGQTLEPHLLVMDIAFIPVRTKLLQDAEKSRLSHHRRNENAVASGVQTD